MNQVTCCVFDLSLAQVAQHLGVNSKTIVEPQQWLAAALDGSRRAMRYIVEALRAGCTGTGEGHRGAEGVFGDV